MSERSNYQELVAPCGMNCGLCIGHLRDKRPCGGCFRKDDPNKPKVCRSCKIANCEFLAETSSGYCFDCKQYPCDRLKKLDKRYRTNYRMSMIENLAFIKEYGIDNFIRKEEEKWKCRICGAGLCVHRNFCLKCSTPVN